MSGDLILGIDGGGSKTLLALANRQGHILETALVGGVNPMDNPNWRAELDRGLAPFRSRAHLAAVAAAFPVFGEVRHLSQAQQEVIAEAFPAARTQVLNDVDAAHRGAFAGQAGVLILSGTGSMAWARDTEGTSTRSGGWGDVIGDEGSSYWIGRLALSLVSQSLDGRQPPSRLAPLVLSHLQIDPADAMNGLGAWVTDLAHPRPAIAALSRLVDQAAREGDMASRRLLDQAADELAKHYRAVAPDANGADWTHAGGTFASGLLLTALEQRIGRPALAPRLPPIGGALLVAAQMLGWSQDQDWLTTTAASARAAVTETMTPLPR